MFCNFNWNWLYFNTHKVSSTSLFLPEIMNPYNMDGTNQIKNDQSLLATRVVIITNYSRQHAVESLVNDKPYELFYQQKVSTEYPFRWYVLSLANAKPKWKLLIRLCACVCALDMNIV